MVIKPVPGRERVPIDVLGSATLGLAKILDHPWYVVLAIERSGASLRTLSTHAATLEDLFVSMTGRELRDA